MSVDDGGFIWCVKRGVGECEVWVFDWDLIGELYGSEGARAERGKGVVSGRFYGDV